MVRASVSRRFARAALPPALFRLLRFVYRLPVYNRMDKSLYWRRESEGGEDCILLDDQVVLRLPDDAIAASVFQQMAFESNFRREWRAFLKLAEGCRSFVDVGASGGFFSALFCITRRAPCRIVSIEPDPASQAVLLHTRERNRRHESEWLVEDRAVSAGFGQAEFISSGYGAMLAYSEPTDVCMRHYASKNRRDHSRFEARTAPLSAICAAHDIEPDIIKIDIDGMEDELVRGCLEWLGATRPRMHLEVHPEFIRDQGRDPTRMLADLARIGYRPFPEPGDAGWLRHAERGDVFHLALLAE